MGYGILLDQPATSNLKLFNHVNHGNPWSLAVTGNDHIPHQKAWNGNFLGYAPFSCTPIFIYTWCALNLTVTSRHILCMFLTLEFCSYRHRAQTCLAFRVWVCLSRLARWSFTRNHCTSDFLIVFWASWTDCSTAQNEGGYFAQMSHHSCFCCFTFE